MKRRMVALLLASLVCLGAEGCPNGDMTTGGLLALAEESRNVQELLNQLPRHMRMNYTFMEKSGSLQPASLEHPRLIHFGSDARFLLAVSTDPSDPEREVLEFADLDAQGHWRFRTLDLRTTPATLAEPAVCKTCHGQQVTRPIWGAYPSWPGSFSPQDGGHAIAAPKPAESHARSTRRPIQPSRFHGTSDSSGRALCIAGSRFVACQPRLRFRVGRLGGRGIFLAHEEPPPVSRASRGLLPSARQLLAAPI